MVWRARIQIREEGVDAAMGSGGPFVRGDATAKAGRLGCGKIPCHEESWRTFLVPVHDGPDHETAAALLSFGLQLC